MELKRKKGNLGEQKALDFLKKKGYRLIQKNYRCRFGEIDLILSKKKKLVFVEVKSGKSEFIKPYQRVDRKKIKKLLLTINHYALTNQVPVEKFTTYQLDVVSVQDDGTIEHFEDILDFEI